MKKKKTAIDETKEKLVKNYHCQKEYEALKDE